MTDNSSGLSMVERMARAILKARYYDYEPDQYASLDAFYLDLGSSHDEIMAEARYEALAALRELREPTEVMYRGVQHNDDLAVWSGGEYVQTDIKSVLADAIDAEIAAYEAGR